MSKILIADSGSTKTHWCLLEDGNAIKHFQTSGINPIILRAEQIQDLLSEELNEEVMDSDIEEIYFYGAGIKNREIASFMSIILRNHFGSKHIESYSDMLGACRALCMDEPGVCGILGTGSNSCYYNGEAIHYHHPSLGYVLGDEGSGTHLGRKVLQYYFYQTFEPELALAFEQKYGSDVVPILDRIYKGERPNQYLASFSAFLSEQRGHYMIENIIEDCFVEFHENHILKYRESWQYPIHFIGSVAFHFRDVLESLHGEYGLTTGKILHSPMDGLINYHQPIFKK